MNAAATTPMRRAFLGSWMCPTGQNVTAYFRVLGVGPSMIDLEWDVPPPLHDADAAYYRETIRPALIARLREYTERIGAALVVEL
jgi:hypothetical protein